MRKFTTIIMPLGGKWYEGCVFRASGWAQLKWFCIGNRTDSIRRILGSFYERKSLTLNVIELNSLAMIVEY